MKKVSLTLLVFIILEMYITGLVLADNDEPPRTISVRPEPVGVAGQLEEDEKVLIPLKTLTISKAVVNLATIADTSRIRRIEDGSKTMKVLLQASNGRYLVCQNGGGGLVTTKIQNPSWQTFSLIDNSGGKLESEDAVYLKASDGNHYLAAQDGGGINASSTQAGNLETFHIISTEGKHEINFGDSVALHTGNRMYVTVRPDGTVMANSRAVRQPETFKLRMVMATVSPAVLAKAKESKAVKALPIATYNVIAHGLKEGVIRKNGQGPKMQEIHLYQDIYIDPELEQDFEPNEILDLYIFEDKNPASGYFYFAPKSYKLLWSKDKGYNMRIMYLAAEEGEAGDVQFALDLDSGVGYAEIQLAKKLLEDYLARQGKTCNGLEPLPINETPKASFTDDLQNLYDIQNVSTLETSDILEQIRLMWNTDSITKENLQIALTEDMGINGTIAFKPTGADTAELKIPASVKISDSSTFGKIPWTRDQSWHNQTLYPIRLRYLHALMLNEQDKKPIVYSWNLNNTEVPPGAEVEFDGSKVPKWLDSGSKKAWHMWIDYTVDSRYEDGDRAAITEITAGVGNVIKREVTFHTIDPLESTGAYEISARIRSKYFDLKSRDMQYKVLTLDEDGKDFAVGSIYLVNRQPGESIPDDPLLEYSLKVTMISGKTYPEDAEWGGWIPSDSLRVLIGEYQIERSVGTLPDDGSGGER